MKSINPYNQQTIQEFDALLPKEIDHILKRSSNTFEEWKNTNIDDRIFLCKEFIQQLTLQKRKLAKLITNEMGKPIHESLAEIEKCIDLVSYFINHTKIFLQPTIEKHGDITHITDYQPTGIVLGIMPWNFPFWQVFRYAIPNILAGNVCMLKHAPNVLGCGNAIEQLFLDAGFPTHIFKHVIIEIEHVEQIIAHDHVQGVCVTGSTKAGSAVASLAGKYIKKSVLELGGSDAFVVLEDANFKKTLQEAFISRMLNAGQVCIAAKRIFIPQQQLDESIAFLKKLFENIICGDPLKEATSMGPISKPEFLPTLKNQVDKAIQYGAHLILGGNVNFPYFEPTLLIMDHQNPALQEEIFGPVICIIPYKDELELPEMINHSEYGLGCSIWSKDEKKAIALAKKIEVGYVSINSMVKSDPSIPFGGVKKSGYGKELGLEGFRSFLNEKSVVLTQ